jgi:hypothetical protein
MGRMKEIDYGHWDVTLVGEFDPDKHFGFVYQITRKDNGKSYIGCKHLFKYQKRKRIKASEWRYYTSSSNYLNPEIKELGKEAFTFQILMLCDNKRNLYYNEAKLQMEMGVLESDGYYNANVGGVRFFRPVRSYLTDALIARMSGTNNPAYRGPFTVSYADNTTEYVEAQTIKDWCAERSLDHRRIYELRNGKLSEYKEILKLEYDDEREDNRHPSG